ncbi:MAG: MGH1-like glycoside hydrolase domain-containing protein [Terriglobales bacterium]
MKRQQRQREDGLAESLRLAQDGRREKNWKRWGPFLPERQWATVREDYSAHGTCWDYFPHDHARSRAYHRGEDGLAGVSDDQQRLCFAVALWNGQDPILKERLFGLTNSEGNHGEDVKECYFYLDGTPTHSYQKALYKYPQAEFPYGRLVEENRRRGPQDREFELVDTGIFDENRYFDVFVEYAKGGPNDTLIRITACNRGPEAAVLHLLPSLWFRNVWSWGRVDEDYHEQPRLRRLNPSTIEAEHPTLGRMLLAAGPGPSGAYPELLFTDNETNAVRLFGTPNPPFVKDAFHEYIVHGRQDAVNEEGWGTKAAVHYFDKVPPGGEFRVELRLYAENEAPAEPLGAPFDQIFESRIREADEFYAAKLSGCASGENFRVARQAFAGLLWSKQFYEYIIPHWLDGDPRQPTPPEDRKYHRNGRWTHLHCRDVLSVPDKWEFPWFAAWDHAFHLVTLAEVDPEMAKHQAILFLREWYMHPNGQLPAYEFALDDVNPPVHAWACWRIYKMTGRRGQRDRVFLERALQKLLLNFTWWVNCEDHTGKNLFAGGFLGFDNIGLFDRSTPPPPGFTYVQADGTAWMAFYCLTMLAMSLELALENKAYEDIASKFFEHFVAIVDAMNNFRGTGLWDEQDGFYYDGMDVRGESHPVRARSMVGLVTLFAVEVLEDEVIDQLPGFKQRLNWFLKNRPDLGQQISYAVRGEDGGQGLRLLAIPSRQRLERVLQYLFDESEFLSPYGIRALSAAHRDKPCVLHACNGDLRAEYSPAESTTSVFGGNSNWRGPVWFPVNYLLVEALQRYHYFYGDSLTVEVPIGSGRRMNLAQAASEVAHRLIQLFLPDRYGQRPCHGGQEQYATDPHWRDLILFSEYFHGDNGRGCGASHQTGWTALVVRLLQKFGSARPTTLAKPAKAALAGKI